MANDWREDDPTPTQEKRIAKDQEKLRKLTGHGPEHFGISVHFVSKGEASDLINAMAEVIAEHETEPPNVMKRETENEEANQYLARMRVIWPHANGQERVRLPGVAKNVKTRANPERDFPRLITANELAYLRKAEKRIAEKLGDHNEGSLWLFVEEQIRCHAVEWDDVLEELSGQTYKGQPITPEIIRPLFEEIEEEINA